MLCAVKVLNSQVVVAKSEALLVGDLPDTVVCPLPTLQLPLLSLLQSINLQVIGGSESELLPYVIVPGKGGSKRQNLFNFSASSHSLNPPQNKVRHVTEWAKHSLVQLRAVEGVVEGWRASRFSENIPLIVKFLFAVIRSQWETWR